jgi:hypothetical protein
MKILEFFTASKEDKDKKQAERVSKALKRGQEALIDRLESEVDKAQDTMDRLLGGDVMKINTETFNEKYHEARMEIILLDKEIEIAKATLLELF